MRGSVRASSPRAEAGECALVCGVQARHHHHRQCYGNPRMTADLRPAGWLVNQKRVARLMRQAGIRACGRCRRRYITQSQHASPVVPHRLGQPFGASAPNRVWVTDITSVASKEGWVGVCRARVSPSLTCHSTAKPIFLRNADGGTFGRRCF